MERPKKRPRESLEMTLKRLDPDAIFHVLEFLKPSDVQNMRNASKSLRVLLIAIPDPEPGFDYFPPENERLRNLKFEAMVADDRWAFFLVRSFGEGAFSVKILKIRIESVLSEREDAEPIATEVSEPGAFADRRVMEMVIGENGSLFCVLDAIASEDESSGAFAIVSENGDVSFDTITRTFDETGEEGNVEILNVVAIESHRRQNENGTFSHRDRFVVSTTFQDVYLAMEGKNDVFTIKLGAENTFPDDPEGPGTLLRHTSFEHATILIFHKEVVIVQSFEADDGDIDNIVVKTVLIPSDVGDGSDHGEGYIGTPIPGEIDVPKYPKRSITWGEKDHPRAKRNVISSAIRRLGYKRSPIFEGEEDENELVDIEVRDFEGKRDFVIKGPFDFDRLVRMDGWSWHVLFRRYLVLDDRVYPDETTYWIKFDEGTNGRRRLLAYGEFPSTKLWTFNSERRRLFMFPFKNSIGQELALVQERTEGDESYWSPANVVVARPV